MNGTPDSPANLGSERDTVGKLTKQMHHPLRSKWRFGHESFSGSRRPCQEHSSRDLSTNLHEALGCLVSRQTAKRPNHCSVEAFRKSTISINSSLACRSEFNASRSC